MEFRENVPLDQSRVRYGGGSGGGGGGRRGPGIAVGGGIGGILVLLLALFFGGNVGDLLGGLTADQGQQGQLEPADPNKCKTTNDIATDPDCRWAAYEVALTDFWSQAYGKGFEPPAAVQLFTGQVATACGTGTSEMGPFYCPGDTIIYLDDEFMGQLLQQLGTERSHAAELYIVGHEYGHHISNLTGQMKAARAALETILAGHEPYPALAIDRHWQMLHANAAIGPLLSGVGNADLLRPPVNVLRLSLHPQGLAPGIENLGEWRAHLLHRLGRQIALAHSDRADRHVDTPGPQVGDLVPEFLAERLEDLPTPSPHHHARKSGHRRPAFHRRLRAHAHPSST